MHLHKEIETLKKQILSLGAEVEDSVQQVIASLKERDTGIADRIILADRLIDEHEVILEEECLKILALHQPVAIDLRFIIAVFKMNNDLERIGDLAVNISLRSSRLAEKHGVKMPPMLFEMAEKTRRMLHGSLDALVNLDTQIARKICRADDDVDDLYREIRNTINATIHNDINRIHSQIDLLEISHYFERIADLTTNIAEDVIYMVDGVIVRHGHQEDAS